jgi:hypothetical protein
MELAPISMEYVPNGQSIQDAMVLGALALLEEYFPAGHCLHLALPYTSEYDPIGHSRQLPRLSAASVGEKVPGGQERHCSNSCTEPIMPLLYFPGRHEMHEVLAGMLEYFPGWQAVQLDMSGNASVTENVPVGQPKHAEELAAPVQLRYVPLEQLLQAVVEFWSE